MVASETKDPPGASAARTFHLIIPVLNAEAHATRQARALLHQTVKPDRVTVLDSESTDAGIAIYENAGFEIVRVPRAQFDHGDTRNLGLRRVMDEKIVVYMTQDAIPASDDCFEKILAAFVDPLVGLACGRQLPRKGAGAIESHARFFNYPPGCVIRGLEDARRAGVRSIFNSNSFAAYRRDALEEIGGFPSPVIMGEDQVAAARMVLAGWKLAYQGDAAVYHSHGYTIREEFRRYFDIGVFHATNAFIHEKFGTSDSEGRKFVLSELSHLWRHAKPRIPEAMLRTVLKFTAYHLGRNEAKLPRAAKLQFAMHKNYFASKDATLSAAASPAVQDAS